MAPHGLMMCEVNEQCWGKVCKNIMKLKDSKVHSFAQKLAHGGVRVSPFIKGVEIDERMCKCGLPTTVNHILFHCNRGTSWDGMKRLLGTTQQPTLKSLLIWRCMWLKMEECDLHSLLDLCTWQKILVKSNKCKGKNSMGKNKKRSVQRNELEMEQGK